MAKKLGRLALFSALAGAAAAGAYYYLQKKAKSRDDNSDDPDDFDDFDEDLENEDFSAGNTGSRSRTHVPLDIDNAKEVIGEKVIERLDKTKERLEHFNVSEKIDKAKEIIGEMTAAPVEPVYTEMDMSAAAAETAADSTEAAGTTDNPSAADAESAQTEDTTEEFFDDSKTEA